MARPTADQRPTDLPDEIDVPEHVIELVPESVAVESSVLPLADTPSGIVLAMSEPDLHERLRFLLNREIQVVYVTLDWIELQIERHYHGAA